MTKLKEDFEASGGVWKEWKMGDLFVSSNGNFDIQQTHINGKGDYVVSSGEQNNGIIGKTDVVASVFDKNTITVDMFGNVFFRDFRYKMVTHARVFSLKFISEKFTEKSAKYVTSNLYFLKESFSYSNMASWNKIADKMVKLPTFKGEPSYSYMEQYISLLEEEKMLQVDKFLKDSGLNDTTLTAEETSALEKFRNGEVKFVERKIGELFEIRKGKRLTKANMKPGMTNFLGAISNNNGIREQIEAPFTWKPNCISVNYNGSVGYSFYQEYEFYASDDVNLCYAKEWTLNKYIALYFCAIFFKYSNVFNFGFKWSKEKMEESLVKVPVTLSNIPDFAFMQHFISALEKLVMRGVVKYKDEMLNAYDKALDFAVAAEQMLNYGQKSEFL